MNTNTVSSSRLQLTKLSIATLPTKHHQSDRTYLSLDQLAKRINELHGSCEEAFTIAQSAQNSALEYARQAGLLLLQAKRECGHGNWEKWRLANLSLPSSTAALYQRIANNWGVIQEFDITTLKSAASFLRKDRVKALPSSSSSRVVAIDRNSGSGDDDDQPQKGHLSKLMQKRLEVQRSGCLTISKDVAPQKGKALKKSAEMEISEWCSVNDGESDLKFVDELRSFLSDEDTVRVLKLVDKHLY